MQLAPGACSPSNGSGPQQAAAAAAMAVPPELLQRFDVVLSTCHGIASPEAEALDAACSGGWWVVAVAAALGAA